MDGHKEVVCCHRQGMSVASATNLLVVDSHFTDTNGTAPMCGCDLEPDWPFYRLGNVTFRRCDFSRNANCGFGKIHVVCRAVRPSR